MINYEFWLYKVIDYIYRKGVVTDISDVDDSGTLEKWYDNVSKTKAAEKAELKIKVLEKLTPEEREALGF